MSKYAIQFLLDLASKGWGGEGVLGLPLDFINVFLGTYEGGHPMGFLLRTGFSFKDASDLYLHHYLPLGIITF